MDLQLNTRTKEISNVSTLNVLKVKKVKPLLFHRANFLHKSKRQMEFNRRGSSGALLYAGPGTRARFYITLDVPFVLQAGTPRRANVPLA